MENNSSHVDDPHAALERMLIDEFLETRGLTRHSANALPAAEATTLMTAASEYASLRLAEIESRARYTDEIHRPL
jgi:hypothetical protein